MTITEVPLAVVEGETVVKVAPLRLVVTEGPGLVVTHGASVLLIDTEGGPADADRLSTMAGEADAGVVVSDSLTADPRPMGSRVAYEIRAEGRRIVWAPFATEIPAWAAGADLFFASPEVERGDFGGRLADATDVGATYLLRRSSLVGRSTKSVGDKADPAGELQARHLIRWYERGGGAARIAWGTPGAFDRCVRIANDHMTTEQAQGFCNLRSKGATGRYAGERVGKGSLWPDDYPVDANGVPVPARPNPTEQAPDRAGLLRRLRELWASKNVAKALSAAAQAKVAAETERIKANRTGLGTKPHRFKAAQWTHPNGHPRCILCGDEESTDGEHPGWTAKADGVSQSAMVALYPSREVAEMLALEGGEDVDELHITLAYLGSDAVAKLDREKVVAALAPLAAASKPLDGEVSGLGRFTPGYPAGQEPWPLYASIDLPALPEFRQRLVATLEAVGVEVAKDHGFTPHLTLAYVEAEDEEAAAAVLAGGVPPIPLHFGEIVLVWGEDRISFRLAQPREDPAEQVARAFLETYERLAAEHRYSTREASAKPWAEVPEDNRSLMVATVQELLDQRVVVAKRLSPDEAPPEPRVFKAVAGPVVKSDEAKRYTFAPLYPASSPTGPILDAHGEFMDADDLQKSVWDYVRAGDRNLTHQHLGDDAVIGEWVELVSWPFAVVVPLTLPTGETVTKSYEPGTVFMGAVWNETGWDLIRKGTLRGFSLEGFAARVVVEVAA